MSARNDSHSNIRRHGLSAAAAITLVAQAFGAAHASPSHVPSLRPPGSGADRTSAAETFEKRRIGYQKFVSDACAEDNPRCTIVVTNLGTNRQLEVTAVSCLVQSAGPPVYLELYSAATHDYLVPKASDYGFAAVNALTRFVVPHGQSLSISYLATDDVFAVNCKIAGEKVVLSGIVADAARASADDDGR